MRWIFLALLMLSLPLLTFYAGKGSRQRAHLLLACGALLFSTGAVSLDGAIISWPLWPGTSRGIIVSFVDMIAIALLVTRNGRMRPPPFLIVSALFAVPMGIATLLAPIKLASVFSLVQFAQVMLLFVALSHELTRPGAMTSLLKGMAIGLIVQAGFVIEQKLTGVVQASGTFVHQNILGLVVQLSAIPLLAAVLEGEKSKLIYGGILASAICVAGGGSRASLAFFAVAVALTLALSLARRASPRKWKILGLAAALTLLFVPLALATLQERFGTLQIDAEDESRDAFERAARAIADDHPLGVGPNNFVSVNNTQGYAVRAGIEWGGGLLDKPAHNAYLLARAETGWAGQATLVLLLLTVGFSAYRAGFTERRAPVTGVAIGSAAGITTMALHSNYEFAWYLLEVQRLFFVNAAIVAACLAIGADARRRARQERREALAAAARGAEPVMARPMATKG